MRSSFSTILLLYHVLSIWNFLILTCTIYILAPHFPHPREDSEYVISFPLEIILQSTSLIRGKTNTAGKCWNYMVLQSTSLIRGKTPLPRRIQQYVRSSIHFPHPREDSSSVFPFIGCEILQSTSLIRGKTDATVIPSGADLLQSTSLIRGKTTM